MGDTVVFQDEVAAPMDAAFAAELEVSALHNHFFYDEPKVYFMHIGGSGDPKKLASGVREVWDAIKRVRAEARSSRRTARSAAEWRRENWPPESPTPTTPTSLSRKGNR